MDKEDRPQKVKSKLEELEVLSRLKDSLEWAIAKRVAFRYIDNLKSASFKLTEENKDYLAVRHAEFAGQALGIKTFIKFVEQANKRLSQEEEHE